MNAASRPGADGPTEDPPRPADDAWPAMDALRLGCVACDAAGRIVRWNAAAAELLGEELLRAPLSRWPDHATFRGDDGRVLAASALPFGPSAVMTDAPLAERLLLVQRPGAETLTLAALVQPWDGGGGGGGSLSFIRSAERARRIADAGRERLVDVERRLRRQVALVRTARVAGSAGEDRTRLPRLLEQLQADLPADVAGVVLMPEVDERRPGAPGEIIVATPTAEAAAAAAATTAATAAVRHLHDSGAGAWIRTHRRPLTVSTPALHPFAGGEGPAAWAAVPLAAAADAGDTIVGVLYALHEQERQYDGDDLAYLEAVADQAAGAVVRGRLIARLQAQTEELTAHRDRLEQLVAERTRDLAESHARLRVADRLAAIGTFTAGLGHDMENVLFPLRCRLDAIGPDQLPDEGPLTATIDATRHALGFLRDLADGLRLFARDPLDGPPDAATDLAAWWSRVAPLIRHSIPAGLELDASIPRDLPPARVPAAGLTQAVLNLVVNAADACDAGGTISVDAALDSADDGRLRLTVRDDGRGMSPEVAAQAFDPFFSTRTRTVSTGLGLWLVHQVTERAGGRIDVDTAPGRGTAITLVLPIVAAVAGSAVMDEAAEAESATTRRFAAHVAVTDERRRAWIIRAVEDAGGRLAGSDDAALLIRDADAPPASRPARLEIRLGGEPPAGGDENHAGSIAHHVPDPDDLATIRRLLAEAATDLTPASHGARAIPSPRPPRPESDR